MTSNQPAKNAFSSAQIESEAARQMKFCGSCKTERKFSDFNNSLRGRHGLHNHCRACQAITRRRWYEQNAESEKEKQRARRPSDKLRQRERYSNDSTYRDRHLAYNRERRRSPHCREMANRAKRELEIRNPSAKIARNLRIRTRKAMLGLDKSASTTQLLGCSMAELATYLENRFKVGMSWENYGYRGWHIDHIRPCAGFDLTDPDQQRACFHFSNLQPEWRFDNQSKGCRQPSV